MDMVISTCLLPQSHKKMFEKVRVIIIEEITENNSSLSIIILSILHFVKLSITDNIMIYKCQTS